MCGICGIYYFEIGRSVESQILNKMCNKLIHRGPDDEGYYLRNNVGLGMRRLSIIDLETGHQPIFSEDKNKVVICNGEIYNFPLLRDELQHKGHRFQTKTDTETIVHLYEEQGHEFLKELNGIFALALYDENKNQLTLARDFVGVKPLYYYLDSDKLIFGSEIKAILAYEGLKKEIDAVALSQYITLGYVPSPKAIFRNIKKLPPAHLLVCDLSGVKFSRYWQLNYITEADTSEKREEKEYSDELLRLLKGTVRRQLVSDVPLGILLSGGVDSSGITALATECLDKPLNTFSIGFRNKGYYDERQYARKIAKAFDTNHYEFEVESEIQEVLPQIVSYFDEPFADSSAIPTYYVSQLASRYVKVVLSGTGGDDILGGYRRYISHKVAKHLYIFPTWVLKLFLVPLKAARPSRISSFSEYILLIKRFLDTAGLDDENRYFKIMSIFSQEEREKLFIERNYTSKDNLFSLYFHEKAEDNFLNQALYVDLNTYLPDDLLVKEDRMTMAWSLEGRVPFLDKEIIEFAATLPPDLKLKRFTTKYILKSALSKVLPPQIVHRKKHGFAFPIEDLFRNHLKEMAYYTLLSNNSGVSKFFDLSYVKEIIEKHQDKRYDLSPQLWTLLIFELWYEHLYKRT
jgi:asparagine synthase (glutamine-hydrolysing)